MPCAQASQDAQGAGGLEARVEEHGEGVVVVAELGHARRQEREPEPRGPRAPPFRPYRSMSYDFLDFSY